MAVDAGSRQSGEAADGGPAPSYDVFLSWTARGLDPDGPHPSQLVDALRSAGLSVFFYPDRLELFATITDEVLEALAGSRTVLCWVSPDYLGRPACLEELQLSLLAEERELDAGLVGSSAGAAPTRTTSRRVFSLLDRVGPEAVPARMSELILSTVSDAAEDGWATAVEKIHAAVASVDGPFGPLNPPEQREGIGADGWRDSSRRFVGRLGELFELRDHLHFSRGQVGPGADGRSAALVAGFGGAGKSLLAAEYAHRFAAAYPGGWFWLSARGNDVSGKRPDEATRNAVRRDEWFRVANSLGLQLDPGVDEKGVRAAVSEALSSVGTPVLWIVDDLATGVTRKELDGWRCEGTKNVFTLFTSRDVPDQGLATVRLSSLEPNMAVRLMLMGHKSVSEKDLATAIRICERLGYHPLATDMAGRAAVREGFDAVESALDTPVEGLDTLVAEIGNLGNLPGDHAREIVLTLRSSIVNLCVEARWLLCLAAVTGDVVLPRGFIDACAIAQLELDDESPGDDTQGEPAVGAEGSNPAAWSRRAFNQALTDGCADLVETSAEVPGIRVHTLVAGAAAALADSHSTELERLEQVCCAGLTARFQSAGQNAAEHICLSLEGTIATGFLWGGNPYGHAPQQVTQRLRLVDAKNL